MPLSYDFFHISSLFWKSVKSIQVSFSYFVYNSLHAFLASQGVLWYNPLEIAVFWDCVYHFELFGYPLSAFSKSFVYFLSK